MASREYASPSELVALTEAVNRHYARHGLNDAEREEVADHAFMLFQQGLDDIDTIATRLDKWEVRVGRAGALTAVIFTPATSTRTGP